MKPTYFVKTRNWNCNRTVKRLLDLAPFAVQGDSYEDGDGKYGLTTASPLRAWLTWAYWIALRPFSGGWTYIVRPGHEIGDGYRAIY